MPAISRSWRFLCGNNALLRDRKSTRLNSSLSQISYAVFCLKKKTLSLKLKHPEMLSIPIQVWVYDESFELDYHVRGSALPSHASSRPLATLVSRTHVSPHGI